MTAAGSAASRNSNPEIHTVLSERAARAASMLREALALLECGSSRDVSPLPPINAGRLLRLPEVQRLTGLRRSAIYQQMQCGTFPRSVKVDPRAVTWSQAAVQVWIAQRLAGERP